MKHLDYFNLCTENMYTAKLFQRLTINNAHQVVDVLTKPLEYGLLKNGVFKIGMIDIFSGT